MPPDVEPWIRDYVLLAFRIDQQLRAVDSYLVDAYYGPPTWRTVVENAPSTAPIELVRQAAQLADMLPAQGFSAQREAFLVRQVRALETISRKLDGEIFAPEEEVERCLDIRPGWVPEHEFERGLALYEAALPGAGSLAERYQRWRNAHDLPAERSDLLLSMMQRTLAEARRRTHAFVDLPAAEQVQAETVSGQLYGAANWYLGGYRSRLEINLDLPVNLASLVKLMCHEAYPGHHTEFTLKEQLLYHGQQQIEQSLFLILTPQLVISEGIATLAESIVFTPVEAARWLADEIFPQAGLTADPTTLAQLHEAMRHGRGISGNAWFMVREGRPDADVLRYVMHYTLWSEARAAKLVRLIKSPYFGAYVFTYFYGERLMQRRLHGPGQLDMFRRFLSEPIYPSQIDAM